MTLGSLMLAILLLLFLGLVPVWPFSRPWGYHPAGVVMIAVVLVLMLMSIGQL